AYNEPSTGGSGDAFVIAMLYKYSDYNKYVSQPFSASNEKDWDAAFAALKGLAPSLYGKGTYPKGNAGTLDLLNRGEIWMGTVWSDQSTQALQAGQLPKTVKITQINPAFNGGAAYIGITKNATHKQAAMKYLNFLLDPAQQSFIVTGAMSGYPGIDWQYMPSDARSRFSGADKEYRLWLDNYAQLATSDTLRANVIFTVFIAVTSVAIVFVIAYVIALALRFGKGPTAKLLGRIYIVPLFIPSVIASYAMITFLANHGFVDGILQAFGLPDGAFPKIVFDWKGIVITQVWLSLPFMTVLLSSVLLEISDSLIE